MRLSLLAVQCDIADVLFGHRHCVSQLRNPIGPPGQAALGIRCSGLVLIDSLPCLCP